jgi:cytochrome b561
MATAADVRGSALLRYSRGAVFFHWTIAALILVNLFLGFYHESFGKPATAWLMFFHKAIGISVLALSVARLGWRLGHRPPPFDPVLKRWEGALATITHWLFYVLMIGIPLSGWLLSSTGNRSIDFFGLFDIGPLPVSRSDDSHDLWEEVHELAGKLMLGLVVLHVAGALKHHLQGHRHLIGRMAPWPGRGR